MTGEKVGVDAAEIGGLKRTCNSPPVGPPGIIKAVVKEAEDGIVEVVVT